MKIVKYRYFNVLLHALIWSIVLSFPYFISSAGNQYKIGPLPGFYFTLSGIIHMIIFYGNAFLLYPKLFNRTYWFLYMISVIVLIIFSFWVKFYLLERWFPDDLQGARSHILFPSLLVFIVSTFYSIAVDRMRAEKLQQENKTMQLGMELRFLRSQISPHFLFNVLTSLVSLARKKSDHLETSLLMLSRLMRYMLYDAAKKISLQQEVEYLESYIALQQLRFGRDVNIISNIELLPEEKNFPIEPMLLIPFVENAFKHGTGYEDRPEIDINLTVKQGVLVFQVKNKFDWETDTSKDESPGIGLSNVRSRLTLLYPGRHNLVIQTNNSLFSIHLTLKLLL
ncbi:sensor histidine kinase [Paraflavitalea devenefica]|uniref:sensor histidine kinase n=1 Tax=Paraflavitalea devenefica TaxID=2716334 RepID=UPI001ABBB84A|nr:sensor histidine kinase [Paraflavitalea devenefica]